MSWVFLVFASAITVSFTRILQKSLLKSEQSDPFAFGFVFQMTVSALFFLYTWITGTFEFPDLSGLAINFIVMTLFYSLANLCIFKAFKYSPASEVSIVLTTSTMWSVISSLVLLGEQITLPNVGGILMIISGVITISYTHTTWKLNKGHLFALLGAVMLGVAFTNDAFIVGRYHSISSYMAVAFALPAILTLFYSPRSIKHLRHFAQVHIVKELLICSTLYALSAITVFTAYKMGGQASLISPIQSTSIIFTVLFSYIFLKERDKIVQKVVGTVLAFLGVLLLL